MASDYFYERRLYESKEDYQDCYFLDSIKDSIKMRNLLKRGYRFTKHYDLNMREGVYLTKKQKTESPQHAFLVWAIANYLKEKGFSVWTYKTIKPDIIFEFQNRKIAIEIETGKNLVNNKRQFLRKVASLKENYGYNWFFVVTNKNLVSKYREYGYVYTRKNVKKAIQRYVNFKPKSYTLKYS